MTLSPLSIDHSFPAHPLASVHSYILLLAYYPITCSLEVSRFQLNRKLIEVNFLLSITEIQNSIGKPSPERQIEMWFQNTLRSLWFQVFVNIGNHVDHASQTEMN